MSRINELIARGTILSATELSLHTLINPNLGRTGSGKSSYARKPDLIIFLHVPIRESVQRRNKTRFHEELYEKAEKLAKIRQNYLEICTKLKSEGENVLVIDGARDKGEVFRDIRQAFQELFI